MATHTANNTQFGRKFTISRLNGQSDKNGKPFFFEWLPELPADQTGRKFETRNRESGSAHYELFSALDGILTGIGIEAKQFESGRKPERWLAIEMQDEGEKYRVEIGRLDSRWAMDFLKRILDPAFRPDQKLRISPYAFQDGERWNIGISCMSGVDGKLSAKYEDAHLAGMPQPKVFEIRGEKQWDFTEVAEWLFEQATKRVSPSLVSAAPAPQYTTEPITSTTASPAASRMEPAEFAVPTAPANPAMAAGFPETAPEGVDENILPF